MSGNIISSCPRGKDWDGGTLEFCLPQPLIIKNIILSKSKKQIEKYSTGMAQTVKNLPAIQDTWVQSLGQEGPLGKGIATHSSILAWEIPWTEEPGGLQSMGLQRVRCNWLTLSLYCLKESFPAKGKWWHVTHVPARVTVRKEFKSYSPGWRPQQLHGPSLDHPHLL